MCTIYGLIILLNVQNITILCKTPIFLSAHSHQEWKASISIIYAVYLFFCQNKTAFLFRIFLLFRFNSQWRVNIARCDKICSWFQKRRKKVTQLNSSHQTCLFYCRQVHTREKLCAIFISLNKISPHKHDKFYELLRMLEHIHESELWKSWMSALLVHEKLILYQNDRIKCSSQLFASKWTILGPETNESFPSASGNILVAMSRTTILFFLNRRFMENVVHSIVLEANFCFLFVSSPFGFIEL